MTTKIAVLGGGNLGRALATVGDDAVRQAVASAATSSLAREKTKKR